MREKNHLAALSGAIRLMQIVESLKTLTHLDLGADVAPGEGGFIVQFGGRTTLSPQGRSLVLPTQALARLVAAERRVQGDQVNLANMPATRLAHVAIDQAAIARAEVEASVTRFASSDLLCYFAAVPASLRARQEAEWAPLLEWARCDLGLTFKRTSGVMHCAQPEETLAAVDAFAAQLDDFNLAGLAHGAQLFGSAILALAMTRRALGGAAAFAASQIDEAFQIQQWGGDADAAVRARALATEALMLETWFTALGQP